MTAVREARDAGHYDEALRLVLEDFALAARSPRDQGTLFITMFEWELLLEVYPPARDAMQRVRDEQAALLLAGELAFGARGDRWPRSRFHVIIDMDGKLAAGRASYELFLRLRELQPEAARCEAFLVLPAIVEAGDFALAENYLSDPLERLDELNQCARSYSLLPAENEPPRLSAELGNFARDVRLLCTVHRGLGRSAEADALHAAALAGIEAEEPRAWVAREIGAPGSLARAVVAWQMERK